MIAVHYCRHERSRVQRSSILPDHACKEGSFVVEASCWVEQSCGLEVYNGMNSLWNSRVRIVTTKEMSELALDTFGEVSREKSS